MNPGGFEGRFALGRGKCLTLDLKVQNANVLPTGDLNGLEAMTA
jgi:hypothetical protein